MSEIRDNFRNPILLPETYTVKDNLYFYEKNYSYLYFSATH